MLRPCLLTMMLMIGLPLATESRRACGAEPAGATQPAAKVRALMITGGCCHDYQNQKRIISEGLAERIGNIEWTILEYGAGRDVQANIYRQRDWIKGFDLVVHNECFGGVEDPEFVRGIARAHVEHGVPGIVIHCSMHSYRNSPAADTWRAFLGVTSQRHERSKHSLHVVPTDAGTKHPIVAALGKAWDTPNGELYIIERVWPTATVLARVHSEETGNDEPVIWINEYQGVRVFGISLGHHNETIESDTWQAIVAAGWNWAMDQTPAERK